MPMELHRHAGEHDGDRTLASAAGIAWWCQQNTTPINRKGTQDAVFTIKALY
jgi:hypothetical protein